MKIKVLGRGFLGREFERMGYEVLGRDRFDADLALFDYHDFLGDADAVVNCIGKSDRLWCEDPANCDAVTLANSDLPSMLSKYCHSTGKRFVHISTGRLYGDSILPCTEEDPLQAYSFFTASKWAGEQGCNKVKDLIIRPRLLFSGERCNDRTNLILQLSRFKYFVDAVNSVTYTKTVVEAVQALLEAEATGVYNVANTYPMSIHRIATEILPFEGPEISAEKLVKKAGIHIVNNIMCTEKLEKIYTPMTTTDAIREAFQESVSVQPIVPSHTLNHKFFESCLEKGATTRYK
jgi:dTDP-4-dehydrorhamnose reductase